MAYFLTIYYTLVFLTLLVLVRSLAMDDYDNHNDGHERDA